MNYKNPLDDAGKLIANSLSGFIVTVAVLLFVDSFTDLHLTRDLILEASTDTLAVVSLFIAVTSAVVGLIFDSFFHNFGRILAKWLWGPLRNELDYRDWLIKDLGYEPVEFEWIQSLGEGIKKDVTAKYVRFTEVAGATSYSLLLLSVSVVLFLPREYAYMDGIKWKAVFVAVVIIVFALLLFFTSAMSLAKYEARKTAASLDEIRNLYRITSPWRPWPKAENIWGFKEHYDPKAPPLPKDEKRPSKIPRFRQGHVWLGLFTFFMVLGCFLLSYLPPDSLE